MAEHEGSTAWLWQWADHSEEVVWLAAPDSSKVFYVNAAYERLWGRPRSELSQQPLAWLEAVPPEKRASLLDALTRSHAVPVLDDFPIRRSDGAVRWVRARRFPVPGGPEQGPRLLTVVQDVTREREAQRFEVIGRLGAGIAHDFNNLLTVIRGRIEMILALGTAPPEMSGSLQQVIKAAERATRLSRQLAGLSRGLPLPTQAIDVNALIQTLAKSLGRVLGESGDVQMRLAPSLPPVRAGDGILDQIFMNLALDARNAGRTCLLLTTEPVSADERARLKGQSGQVPGVCITIVQQGANLAEVTAPAQGGDQAAAPLEGQPLGLAAVRELVEQLHGSVHVLADNRQLIRLYLPALSQAESAPTTAPAPSAPRTGNGRVLLVEDDPGARTFLSLFLRRLGHQVTEAATGPEAVRLWNEKQGGFDLLLTDLLASGGMSGWDLLRDLRGKRPDLRAVVLITPGHNAELSDNRLRVVGKPFTPDALAEVLRSVFESK